MNVPLIGSRRSPVTKAIRSATGALEWKTGRSGKDTIDARGHEDVANAVAGLLCIAAAPRMQASTMPVIGW